MPAQPLDVPQAPVSLPMVFDERLGPAHLHRLGNTLGPLLSAAEGA